jgi:hypothetical protein
MNQQTLLEKLDSAWLDFNNSYRELPPERLLETGVTGDWSVKDILAHVMVWEEEALKHLPHIAAGGRPPRYSVTYGGIDAFNALKTQEYLQLSLPDLLVRQDNIHRQLVDYIRTVPEGLFSSETRFRRRLRLDTYSHYPIHTKAIREWRERHGY